MTDLIATLEGLTSPSREVDALIWLEFTPGATRKQWSYIHTATGRECHVDETRDATDRLIIVPEYTASLDAITALVERVLPGHTGGFQPGIRGRAWGYVYRVSDFEVGEISRGVASTPAIALCIALLRALEARDGTE